jgi:predicted small lipoprotein YifL
MHCWARYLFIAAVTMLGVGQMMTACGQKGDLYLPEPEAAGEDAPLDEEVEPLAEPPAQGGG